VIGRLNTYRHKSYVWRFFNCLKHEKETAGIVFRPAAVVSIGSNMNSFPWFLCQSEIQFLPHRKHRVFVVKTRRLMLFVVGIIRIVRNT
jgi:hypothetical protein